MPYSAQVFEVLVAGPSDVAEERRAIAEAIEAWNHRHAREMGFVIRPVVWEADTNPELGGDPQSVINQQLNERCDGLIAVFATRLGSPTPRGVSGTAEEIERFATAGKYVAVYFSRADRPISSIDVEQLKSLQTYKESLKSRGLLGDFDSLANLRVKLDQLLPSLAQRFRATQQAATPEQVGNSPGFEPDAIDLRIIAVMGRLLVETGVNRVHSLYLGDEPELVDIAHNRIAESIRVLLSQGLIHNMSSDSSFNRWEIGLTSDGLESWLLNFTTSHERDQRTIAAAIVANDLRTPENIAERTGLPAVIVGHVLQRWAERNLVILNPLYSSVRVDRFSADIQRLAEAATDFKPFDTSATAAHTSLDGPRFRTVAEFGGVDVVALSAFGGELGDPIAAAIRVNGHSVVQVVAPASRENWTPDLEQRFRNAVRRLAETHPLLAREGPVRLVFDPPQGSAEPRDETSGEPVNRG